MKSGLAFLRDHAVPAIVAFLIALALSQMEWVRRFESVTLDRRTVERAKYAKNYVPQPVVISIDDESVEQIGIWPWKRAWHGTFMALAGQAKPSVIAWDILFTEPDTNDPTNDEKLIGGTLSAQKAGVVVIHAAVTNETPGME